MSVVFVFCFFFFFQAEDGIRDHCVTGVQTCALPISGCRVSPVRGCSECPWKRTFLLPQTPPRGPPRVGLLVSLCARRMHPLSVRSEERRVGKECRSRSSTYKSNKTQEDITASKRQSITYTAVTC